MNSILRWIVRSAACENRAPDDAAKTSQPGGTADQYQGRFFGKRPCYCVQHIEPPHAMGDAQHSQPIHPGIGGQHRVRCMCQRSQCCSRPDDQKSPAHSRREFPKHVSGPFLPGAESGTWPRWCDWPLTIPCRLCRVGPFDGNFPAPCAHLCRTDWQSVQLRLRPALRFHQL